MPAPRIFQLNGDVEIRYHKSNGMIRIIDHTQSHSFTYADAQEVANFLAAQGITGVVPKVDSASQKLARLDVGTVIVSSGVTFVIIVSGEDGWMVSADTGTRFYFAPIIDAWTFEIKKRK